MPYNTKFQKRFLKELEKEFGTRAIRPDLTNFKQMNFSAKEIEDFEKMTVIPKKIKHDIMFLLKKNYIEAVPSGINTCYGITLDGIEYLHRPCWLIRTLKKTIENSSIKDVAWLLIAIATFLLALTNYLLLTTPSPLLTA